MAKWVWSFPPYTYLRSAMAHLLRAYNSVLMRRPMAAQCATAAVLFGAGDILAQCAVERRGIKGYDIMRTARLSFYGGAMFGPVFTKWYQFLGRLKFSSPVRGTIYRVWLDQCFITPIAVVAFYSSMTFLEGKGISEAKRRLDAAYVPTLIRNWCVFVPTQVINFSIVPPHLRFFVVGCVSLVWNTYLSYANTQAQSIAIQDKIHIE